jgi:hypothetical protein
MAWMADALAAGACSLFGGGLLSCPRNFPEPDKMMGQASLAQSGRNEVKEEAGVGRMSCR